MPEVVHNVPEGGSVVGMACNEKIMAIAVDTQGVIFYDLIQNLEVSNQPTPPGDAIVNVSCSVSSGEFLASTRRGAMMLFKGCGVLREIQSTAEAESKCDSQETPGGFW